MKDGFQVAKDNSTEVKVVNNGEGVSCSLPSNNLHFAAGPLCHVVIASIIISGEDSSN